MSKCVNENCNNDPIKSMNRVIVSIDGDLACCPRCKKEFENQRDYFLNHIIGDDEKFEEWMGVKKYE